jgi:DNA-directed RNA polymerase II subunit RPB11
LFSGYRVPHPLEPKTVLKIQTDGSLTPIQALEIGCQKIISQTGMIRDAFQAQCKMHQSNNGAGGMGPGGSSGYGGGYGAGVYGDLDQRGADGGGYVDI